MMLKSIAATALALGIVAVPLSAHADTSDFSFDSLDVDYTLSQGDDGEGTAEIVETFVADFPDFDQNRGIIRELPKYYLGVDTELDVHGVTDANGADVPFEQEDVGDYLDLALGTDDYVHGRQTYVISYSARYVIGHYEDTDDDEFYWDVNGTGWEQRFGRVSATVHVDPSIADELTGATSCYVGEQGSSTSCDLTRNDSGDFAVTENDLGPGENVTVVLGFTAGAFTQGDVTQEGETGPPAPELPTPAWIDVLAIVILVPSVALLVLAVVMRIRRSLAAPKAGFIVPQYSVPADLDVMVAAHLVGRGDKAVAAALVSLAVRGKLRILDYPVSASGAEYTLQFLDDTGLSALDQRLMAALFGGTLDAGETRELAPSDSALGSAVNAIVADARAQLTATGLTVRRGFGCGIPALSVLPVLAAFAITFFTSSAGYAPPVFGILACFVSLVLLIAITFISVTGREVRTEKGQLAHDYLEGMKLYLTVAEKDRLRVLQSVQGAERIDVGDTTSIVKLYEKLLPFAVIWDVEDSWAKELEVRAAETDERPDWFVSQRGFQAIYLTSALSSLSQAATYTPPSSSGSGSGSGFSSFGGGSGGGGFSGGGGGGGGGGGR